MPHRRTEKTLVAARLRALIAAEGLTQAAFAARCDIPHSRLRNVLVANQGLTPADAAKIAHHFHVTLDYIYLGELGGVPFRVADRLRKVGAPET